MQLSWGVAALVALGLASITRPGRAQVAEVDLRTQIFHEPSAQSHMTVYTPEVNIQASPSDALGVYANYQADAVTGASEAIKAGPLLANVPDIVSRASGRDFRQMATRGVAWTREHTRGSGSYTPSGEKKNPPKSFPDPAGGGALSA